MKNCNKCGVNLPDEAAFCISCGAPVDDDLDGTTVLDGSMDSQSTGAFYDDLEATGLLNENDLDETGILTEETIDAVYSHSSAADTNLSEYANVNSAFINPDLQQNSVQQYVLQDNAQFNQNDTANGYSANSYQTFAEQPTLKSCYKKFWNNYANFNGRSRRSEYWYVVLANFLISLVNIIPYVGQALYSLYALAIIVPTLALIVRRLHDLGKEWYNIFFFLIPIAGPIIILVWMFTDSQTGANKFGENPKGIN